MSVGPPGGFNPSQLAQMLTPPPPVGPGSPAQAVDGVQQTLKGLGYKIEAKEDQSNTYGPSTQDAVRQFQTDHQLPQTGIADIETRMAMVGALQQKEQARQVVDGFQSRLDIQLRTVMPKLGGF